MNLYHLAPRPGPGLQDLRGGHSFVRDGAHVHHHARVLPPHAHPGNEAGVHEERVQVIAPEKPAAAVTAWLHGGLVIIQQWLLVGFCIHDGVAAAYKVVRVLCAIQLKT